MSKNKNRKFVPFWMKAVAPLVGAGAGFAISKDWIGAIVGAIAAPVIGISAEAAYNTVEAYKDRKALEGQVPEPREVITDEERANMLLLAAQTCVADKELLDKIMELAGLEWKPADNNKPAAACRHLYELMIQNPDMEDEVYEGLDDLDARYGSRTPSVSRPSVPQGSEPQVGSGK